MRNKKFDKINISILFDKEPETGWASRGNPHLWDEMRLKSKNIKLFENENELRNYFYKLFLQITGLEIFDKEYIKINRFLLDSGISNGIVTSSWWIKTGIPILLKRYKKIKKHCFDTVIVKINGINGSNVYYENSIEEAIKRIFMFNKININNLIDLLEMDNNINRISKETKEEIIENIKYKTNDGKKVKMIIEKLDTSKNNCA